MTDFSSLSLAQFLTEWKMNRLKMRAQDISIDTFTANNVAIIHAVAAQFADSNEVKYPSMNADSDQRWKDLAIRFLTLSLKEGEDFKDDDILNDDLCF